MACTSAARTVSVPVRTRRRSSRRRADAAPTVDEPALLKKIARGAQVEEIVVDGARSVFVALRISCS